jgi:UDP-N-acetylglucosamine 2-epimerase (non-hydrolysing)
MKQKKILITFGTRPEAIKMCPLIHELKKRPDFDVRICLSGQHREMLRDVLDFFAVSADYDLDVMKQDQSLHELTSQILTKFSIVLKDEAPDLVMVHGDTTTTLSAVIASFYQRCPVAHIEAGLRTYDLSAPFPEEFNRRVASIVTRFHFAPTQRSKENLIRENVPEETIFVTGNTIIDALAYTVQKNYTHPAIEKDPNKKMILLTAHRRENHGEPLRSIFRGIKRIVSENPQLYVVYPVHPNPNVTSAAREIFDDDTTNRIKLIEPLNVFDFHNFMGKAYMILTDSGGVQEEAPSLSRPVLVLRDTTERPEGVESGTLKLVGTSEEKVYDAIKELLLNQPLYDKMSRAKNPYGDGHASERIADILQKEL